MSKDFSGVESAERIQSLMQPFLEKGFSFEYTYQKGGDSSCVYIYRFKKGRNFFDWRETSGTYEIHLVINVGGQFLFPDPKKKYTKQARAFRWKHLFKEATVDEKRAFFAQLLLQELQENPKEFHGIALEA